jgi:NADH dehydrogenase FAD-containing subunit
VFWKLGLFILKLWTWFYRTAFYPIPPLEERKKVVVVGGGFAGTGVAQNLEPYFHVTLIDTKDYFEFTPSVLRTIVEPTHIKRLQVMHNHYLRSATVIQKEVLRVEFDRVVLDDRTVPYDYLVINSGSTYNPPFKETKLIGSTRGSTMRESNYTLRKAKKVLVIGGGLVGVELAAEIAVHFPKKEVTLVHSQSTLMNRFPKKAIKYVTDFLKDRGVRIVYNERVVGHRAQTFITDQGVEIPADIGFLCTGITPNSGFLKETFPDAIAGNGYVCTNEYLQLSGTVIYPNIFVAGDVLDVKEEKMAQGAEYMAKLVSDNIFYMDKGKAPNKYTSPLARPVVISLGKYHGVFVFGSFVITGPLPALLKEAIEWKTLVRYR